MDKKLTVLMILDGFGLNDKTEGNAIKLANTPNLDRIFSEYPYAKGYASGLAVGLPDGQMGNSEVGHLNMGAGRIIYQNLTKITKSIEEGTFFENSALLEAVENCKANNSALHLFGLLSTGGVHSHLTHIYALLKLAKDNGLDKVYLHAFLDGRDTPPTSGAGFLSDIEAKMAEIGVGKVATIAGRYYAMDRDNNWDRVEKAYNAMVKGEGNKADSAAACMEASYAEGVNDEFVVPTSITENGTPVATIKENDSIIFYNFRPDRAREMTRAFCDADFKGFERANGFMKVKFVCFTDYDETIGNKSVAFVDEAPKNTLGEYISKQGLKQLRIAETEKYAHVTFFFNGGIEEPNPGEERILVPSPKEVATYDLKPEMSAPGVTEKLIDAIENKKADLIIVNYANPDMVGHTGVIPAAVKAIETIDSCVAQVVDALIKVDGQMFICADHGNSDQLVDYTTGKPFTAHTTNPVPFVLVNCHKAKGIMEDGKLCDIAPTLLDMMELPQPSEMTGHSLIIK
jgi:2,3-bisphosphoglycerate-independent phosphoglycerate mutase